ncbi:endonuclease/exonuclease/phosphatase family protein [Prosthecomicrobium pneumaticum]|uniref:Endonuclease/exonuclease/phosphatase family metal-dependent hydrolase n=1 Tax=Prosthecomicrobium pneumaticum TaxID=81895 RepID=A0A7W9CTK2_9HYPH|nr:endonuclease/exonuclease/phosphatase family metal-dependent hydrolase [Prosthecomicrobium pneumaticum]
MQITLASYNIQYGVGKDERLDLERIVAELGDADIVALQEVETGNPKRGLIDQAEALARLLPHDHSAYGPGFDVLVDAEAAGGRSGVRHRFGNMVLSRWPIASVTNHMLPKLALRGTLHLQRALLETVIATPAGPLRFCSTHLDHVSPMTRMAQVEAMQALMLDAAERGGPWGGASADAIFGAADPAWPRGGVVMGDMNFEADSEEYTLLIGDLSSSTGRRANPAEGLFDAWVLTGHAEDEGLTFIKPGWPSQHLDHCFVTADLVPAVRSMWIDEAAVGSDHQPIFVTLELGG